MIENAPLMARRIRRILLVCNNYDNFSLEEEGRLDGRIAREYADLNLSGPPVMERDPPPAKPSPGPNPATGGTW